MKYVIINDRKYALLENYKDAFNLEEVTSKLTEYFFTYDYIVGDVSYGKIRLKGFCKPANLQYNSINDFEKKDEYLKNECSYDCKYFILENLERENKINYED